MGVLAKKKIYPSSNEDPAQQQHPTDDQSNRPANGQRTSRINSQIQLNRNILRQQESLQDDSQFNNTKRNRTFIIRKAFQTGFNQLSNTIKKPVNRSKLTKLDSNNVESKLIQNKFRKNGWSRPIHPLQIGAAFVFLLMTCLLFIYFLPQINLEDERLIYLIYALCILITIVHFVLHILAISINPADDNVIAKQRRQPNKPVPEFDRSKHNHVIENQFCYICEVPVSGKSKHCSRCNICIQNFDHHCNWLNTCIGSKNYKLFISSVISALLGTVIVLSLSILFIVCYVNSNCVWLDNQYLNGLDFDNELDDQTFDNNQTNIDSNLNLTTSFPQPVNTTLISLISNTNSTLDTLSSLSTSASNFTHDNDYTNENFTDSSNRTNEEEETDSDGNNSLQYQTIIHLSIISMSLILSSITIVLLLHLLCFHLFLNCIGLSTYEFIVQRREAAQRNLNQENAADRPTFNERILRCFCSKLLPKAQTELATSQSIIEKNSNQVNLIRKRQLSTQISNESNRSRNSRESGHYSSRTVSLYEDFTANDKNDLNINKTINNLPSIENGNLEQSVYIGSPQRRRRLELEEWKALNNNRSLALDQSLDKATTVVNQQQTTSKQEDLSNSNAYFHHTNDQTNEQIRNYAVNDSLKTLDSLGRVDNKLSELNANRLLINERLEKLNLDKLDTSENKGSSDNNDNQITNQQNNKPLNHQYLDSLNEFMNRQLDDKTNDQSNENNHIKFKNVDD